MLTLYCFCVFCLNCGSYLLAKLTMFSPWHQLNSLSPKKLTGNVPSLFIAMNLLLTCSGAITCDVSRATQRKLPWPCWGKTLRHLPSHLPWPPWIACDANKDKVANIPRFAHVAELGTDLRCPDASEAVSQVGKSVFEY